MSDVRLAVVGVGRMGGFHARKAAALGSAGEGLRLVAVVDLERDRAEAVARETGARAETDFRRVLADVDAVVVAVPTVAHHPVVEAVLAAGCDVLVEKPIAATVGEAEKLLGAARERGRVLQVGHLEWFNAAMRRAAESIRRPRFIEAHRLGPFPERSTDVDVVRDLMIHDLDIVLRLVREEPDRVEAVGVPVVSERVDIANARLGFPGGCVANLTASRVSPQPMRKIRFFQPDAYLSIDFLAQSVTLARRERSERSERPVIHMETLPIDRADALEEQLRAFRDAVRTRRVSAGAGDDGLQALRCALRVIEAMPPFDDEIR